MTNLLVAGLSLCQSAIAADSISISPGKWEMTTTTTLSGLSEPRTDITTECVENGTFRAEDLLENSQQECQITDKTVTDNQIEWTVVCNTNTGPATGNGVFISEGTRTHGTINLTLEFNDQPYTTEITWDGIYQGPCNQ